MIKTLILFLVLCFSTLGEVVNYGKINTREDKIENIDNYISILEKEIAKLETLKKEVNDTKLKSKKPKIALVLSGGGTKGATHIGALKALEKYQIPIDIIVGCSAGSVVGAMYASGYSPLEIEDYLLSQDFGQLFSNSTNRNNNKIIDRVSRNQTSLNFSLDEDNNIVLPQGFSKGENVYLSFKEKFKNFEEVKNFDELPIKFRAVATNINTGKSHVFKDGDLATAVLASMALPPVFNLVENQNNLYTDGGVVDNFPILEGLKEADFVIAVDATAEVHDLSHNSSVVEILDKLVSYNSQKNLDFQKPFADILITPDIKKYFSLDFENLKKIIKEGEIATEYFASSLKPLSDSKRFNEQKSRIASFTKDEIVINNVVLEKEGIVTKELINQLKPSSETLTIEDIHSWTRNIYSLSYVDKVFYEIEGDTINFDINESEKFKILGGFNYLSEDYGGGLTLYYDLPSKNSVSNNHSISAELSSFPKLNFGNKGQTKLGSKTIGHGFNIFTRLDPLFLYGNEGKLLSKYSTASFGINSHISTAVGDNTLTGLSLEYKYLKNYFKSGIDEFIKEGDGRNYIRLNSYVVRDSLDSLTFPRDGSYRYFNVFTGASDEEFYGYKFLLYGSFPLGEKLAISPYLAGGMIKTDSTSLYSEDLFKVGGFHKFDSRDDNFGFAGLPTSGLLTDKLAIGGVNLQYNLSKNLYLIGRYNVITYDSEDMYYQDDSSHKDDFYHGYGLGLGMDTFMGPVEVSVSRNIIDEGILFNVFLGYTF